MVGVGRLAVERALKPDGIGLANGRCQKLTVKLQLVAHEVSLIAGK